MINITVQIESIGITNISQLKNIISLADELRSEAGVTEVNIALIADNVSTLIQNSLNSCGKVAQENCNVTMDELTDDLED